MRDVGHCLSELDVAMFYKDFPTYFITNHKIQVVKRAKWAGNIVILNEWMMAYFNCYAVHLLHSLYAFESLFVDEQLLNAKGIL